jgi:hypothetical protein
VGKPSTGSAEPHDGRRWAVPPVAAALVLLASISIAPATADEAADERTAWDAHKAVAKRFVDEWADWICMSSVRYGPGEQGQPLTDACKARLLCLVRAISWVESRHGTGTGNQPAKDPMQAANPNDSWWLELTTAAGVDRIVRGGDRPSRNINQVPAEADIPEGVRGTMSDDVKAKGHRSGEFTSTMSYGWGVLGFFRKINEVRTYHVPEGLCECKALHDAAVRYNGDGDPDYGKKIDDALALTGCCPGYPPNGSSTLSATGSLSSAAGSVSGAVSSAASGDPVLTGSQTGPGNGTSGAGTGVGVPALSPTGAVMAAAVLMGAGVLALSGRRRLP